MAELGFVGDGPNSYQLWLGGNPAQTALAQPFKERVKVRDLEAELEPLFTFWRDDRKEDEGFGYFVQRVGIDAVKAYAEGFVGSSTPTKEVAVVEEVYTKLVERAAAKGKSVVHVANELLRDAVA
jgi:sulfite reductase (ferredoxin)